MNIGIIIYSQTGNTLSIAKRLQEELTKKGHTATIDAITATNTEPNAKASLALKNIPNASGYDKIILGAPIHGFSLCLAMTKYLTEHADIKGKDIDCIITHHFPYPWLGGTRGMKQMIGFCTSKGASSKDNYIIDWTSKKRESQIAEAVKKLSII